MGPLHKLNWVELIMSSNIQSTTRGGDKAVAACARPTACKVFSLIILAINRWYCTSYPVLSFASLFFLFSALLRDDVPVTKYQFFESSLSLSLDLLTIQQVCYQATDDLFSFASDL